MRHQVPFKKTFNFGNPFFWGGWGDDHADNSFGDQRAEVERSRDKMVDIRKMSKSLC